MGAENDGARRASHGGFFQQTLTLVVLYWSASLLGGEDWTMWRGLPPQAWGELAALVLVVLVGASLLQIWALSWVNAVLFSTLISWRLVVALVVAWPLLGERLGSVWQILGAALVMTAVTFYLGYQAAHPELA